mgnify:CR=1 FL=1
MRGATNGYAKVSAFLPFQLTRPMRGATYTATSPLKNLLISTHTPHAGRDRKACLSFRSFLFQLTRPMRGATLTTSIRGRRGAISTHTPHAGRDSKTVSAPKRNIISTHTPHAGRDAGLYSNNLVCYRFQLTRPMRGATHYCEEGLSVVLISTHTPHAGRDAGNGW